MAQKKLHEMTVRGRHIAEGMAVTVMKRLGIYGDFQAIDSMTDRELLRLDRVSKNILREIRNHADRLSRRHAVVFHCCACCGGTGGA